MRLIELGLHLAPFGILDPHSLNNSVMSSVSFAVVAPGTAAAQRYARGQHIVRFMGPAAQGPVLRQALPKLGWVVAADGILELALCEFWRIVSLGTHLAPAEAQGFCVLPWTV